MYTFKLYSDSKPRTWGVYAPGGELVCVCLYKKGAQTVVDELNGLVAFAELIKKGA